MGAFLSSTECKENSVNYTVTVTDLVLKKLALEPPKKKPEKITEQVYGVEQIETEAIQKMKAMEDDQTNKFNLSPEYYDNLWNGLQESNNRRLAVENAGLFSEERKKVAEAFAGKSFEEKQLALMNYQAAINRTRKNLLRRNLKDNDNLQQSRNEI